MGNHLQVMPGGTTEELRAATDALNRKADDLNKLAVRFGEAFSGATSPSLPPH